MPDIHDENAAIAGEAASAGDRGFLAGCIAMVCLTLLLRGKPVSTAQTSKPDANR
jgi:hypothetical protein